MEITKNKALTRNILYFTFALILLNLNAYVVHYCFENNKQVAGGAYVFFSSIIAFSILRILPIPLAQRSHILCILLCFIGSFLMGVFYQQHSQKSSDIADAARGGTYTLNEWEELKKYALFQLKNVENKTDLMYKNAFSFRDDSWDCYVYPIVNQGSSAFTDSIKAWGVFIIEDDVTAKNPEKCLAVLSREDKIAWKYSNGYNLKRIEASIDSACKKHGFKRAKEIIAIEWVVEKEETARTWGTFQWTAICLNLLWILYGLANIKAKEYSPLFNQTAER